jgi:hypothetical protein
MLFCVASCVRPTVTEFYVLEHNDIALESDP